MGQEKLRMTCVNVDKARGARFVMLSSTCYGLYASAGLLSH